MFVQMHVVEDNVVSGCIGVSEVAAYLVHLHGARQRERQNAVVHKIEVMVSYFYDVISSGDSKQVEGNYIHCNIILLPLVKQ